MVELSANMSWLDSLDWQDLQAFEPVYDELNDMDSVERIAQVEAIATALFQPFFETGITAFDSFPRNQAANNYSLRIHCARSMAGYADYSRHPQLEPTTKAQPSIEEWEHLLVDSATPSTQRHFKATPSPARKPSSAFKPVPPKHPPTPVSHVKSVQRSANHVQSSPSIKREHSSAQKPGKHVAEGTLKTGQQARLGTPESDSDSGEEESGEERPAPPRPLWRQFSSSTVITSDTQRSSGMPSRDAAIADLIRDIAVDSQEIGL